MATIIEHDIHHHHDEETSAVGSIIVALLAVALVVGLALFAFQYYPFTGAAADENTIDVNINGTVPTNP